MERLKQLWRIKANTKKTPTSFRTVKFSFSIMVGALGAFLLANSISSTNNNFVFLSATKTSFTEGEQFFVDVMVSVDEPINTVSATVNFSSDIIEAEGVNVGRSVLTLWAEEPTITGNQIVFSGGSFKRGFKGEHLLGTIKFIAKKSGQAEVVIKNVKLLAGDGLGSEVVSSIKSGLVLRVYQEGESIPETTIVDFNGEKEITLKDISIFITNWKNGEKIFDLNKDGKVNLVDFSILLARYSYGKVGF